MSSARGHDYIEGFFAGQGNLVEKSSRSNAGLINGGEEDEARLIMGPPHSTSSPDDDYLEAFSETQLDEFGDGLDGLNGRSCRVASSNSFLSSSLANAFEASLTSVPVANSSLSEFLPDSFFPTTVLDSSLSKPAPATAILPIETGSSSTANSCFVTTTPSSFSSSSPGYSTAVLASCSPFFPHFRTLASPTISEVEEEQQLHSGFASIPPSSPSPSPTGSDSSSSSSYVPVTETLLSPPVSRGSIRLAKPRNNSSSSKASPRCWLNLSPPSRPSTTTPLPTSFAKADVLEEVRRLQLRFELMRRQLDSVQKSISTLNATVNVIFSILAPYAVPPDRSLAAPPRDAGLKRKRTWRQDVI